MASRTFGLTKTTGPVEGEVQHYAMTDTGTFHALPTELDYSAWDNMPDDEKAALIAEIRSTSFEGFYRQDGAQ